MGAPTGGVLSVGEEDTNVKVSGYPKISGSTVPHAPSVCETEDADIKPPDASEQSSGAANGVQQFSICDDETDDSTELQSMESCESFADSVSLNEFVSPDGTSLLQPALEPAVPSSSSGNSEDFVKQGGHEVTLHIYDVSQEDVIRRVNKVLAHKRSPLKFGGVFHAGVEVIGLEWSYGFSDVETQAGVSCVEPKSHPHHQWRQSVSLGRSPMTAEDIAATLSELVEDWPAGEYDLLRRNCCHFADDFCRRLLVKPIPRWVHRLARVGARADSMYQGFQRAKDTVKGLWRREEPRVEDADPAEHYGRQPIFRATARP